MDGFRPISMTEQFLIGPRETYIIIRTQVLFKVLIFWSKLDNFIYRPNSKLNRMTIITYN